MNERNADNGKRSELSVLEQKICACGVAFISSSEDQYVAFTFHLHHVNAREFTFYDNRLSKTLFDIISTRESRAFVYIVVCPTVDIASRQLSSA